MKHFFSKDQRGVGHVGLIIALVVVMALGAAGWFVYNKNKDAGLSVADKAVRDAIQNAKCEYDDKDLCKFFTGWKAQKYYTVTSTSTVDGETSKTVMKTEGEDKIHMKMEGALAFESITIGSTTYTKAGDTWWKQTTQSESAKQLQEDTAADFEEPTEDTNAQTQTTYKKMGKEKCGNFTCFKYQEVDPADADTDTYIWFDDEEYQLRRVQSTSKDGKTTYESTYTYDKVSITEPSPVKELGPNQYIAPGQTEPTTLPSADEMPSSEELQQLMQQYQ